jgi:hypothetical protein
VTARDSLISILESNRVVLHSGTVSVLVPFVVRASLVRAEILQADSPPSCKELETREVYTRIIIIILIYNTKYR